MNPPIDILAVASLLAYQAGERFRWSGQLNSGPVAAAMRDEADTDLRIAKLDLLRVQSLILELAMEAT